MGSMSIWHWAIVLIVVLVLFGGGGKITSIMGDMAKGIKSFKKNLAEDDPEELDHKQTKQEDASFHNEKAGEKKEPEPASKRDA